MQRQRKTTEWERLEIISRKLEIPREHFMQDRHNKGQKQQGPNRSRRYKKRWQEYTEELYKIGLNDSDNHDSVVSRLEPDILECEVKWALRSTTANKASGDDGIPIELFKILKDDAVQVLHSICQQIWKTEQ